MLKISHHEDVICAQDEVPLLTTTLPVSFFLVDGLLVDTGPSSLAEKSAVFSTFSKKRLFLIMKIVEPKKNIFIKPLFFKDFK